MACSPRTTASPRRSRLRPSPERENATAAFNLGVALEDLGNPRGALDAYASALALEPANPDAHYNSAHLCVRLGETAAALRHLQQYRKLSRR